MDFKKLVWHSRRGMLELDLLLLPFARTRLRTLSSHQQALYRQLLEEQDQDLFAWLIEREKHPAPPIQELIRLIRHSATGAAGPPSADSGSER